MLDICQPKTVLQWQKVTQYLPSNIVSFCRRYLIVSLPSNSNLSRWKKISNETCTLCENVTQTQRHVICHAVLKCLKTEDTPGDITLSGGEGGGRGTLNVEVIGMLVGNFLGKPLTLNRPGFLLIGMAGGGQILLPPL